MTLPHVVYASVPLVLLVLTVMLCLHRKKAGRGRQEGQSSSQQAADQVVVVPTTTTLLVNPDPQVKVIRQEGQDGPAQVFAGVDQRGTNNVLFVDSNPQLTDEMTEMSATLRNAAWQKYYYRVVPESAELQPPRHLPSRIPAVILDNLPIQVFTNQARPAAPRDNDLANHVSPAASRDNGPVHQQLNGFTSKLKVSDTGNHVTKLTSTLEPPCEPPVSRLSNGHRPVYMLASVSSERPSSAQHPDVPAAPNNPTVTPAPLAPPPPPVPAGASVQVVQVQNPVEVQQQKFSTSAPMEPPAGASELYMEPEEVSQRVSDGVVTLEFNGPVVSRPGILRNGDVVRDKKRQRARFREEAEIIGTSSYVYTDDVSREFHSGLSASHKERHSHIVSLNLDVEEIPAR